MTNSPDPRWTTRQARFTRTRSWIGRWLLFLTVMVTVPCAQAAQFYVVRHGWHSGIVVNRADIPADAWPPGVTTHDFAGCRCLELGWGDRAFYMAPHPTVLLAVRAALIPSPSVLHVAGFTEPPSKLQQWAEVVPVSCTRAEFMALCQALSESFTRDANGHAIELGAGLYGFKSHFYAARGSYWLGDTCNSWTLREARASGLPTRLGPACTLNSGAAMAQVRRLYALRARR